MKILAIANNKGGCAKSTTTYHLGKQLADAGVDTLLIDLDPQANLTERYQEVVAGERTIARVLGGAAAPSISINQAIHHTDTPRLALAPSEFQLANVALGLLNDAVRGRAALRRALAACNSGHELVIIDCPPEAGILLVNALLAADGVLCPAEPEPDAMAGVGRVVGMAEIIRNEYARATPAFLGCLATRVDERTNRHLDGMEALSRGRAPLLGRIPERNGAQRERQLADAYAPIAQRVLRWLKEGVC